MHGCHAFIRLYVLRLTVGFGDSYDEKKYNWKERNVMQQIAHDANCVSHFFDCTCHNKYRVISHLAAMNSYESERKY